MRKWQICSVNFLQTKLRNQSHRFPILTFVVIFMVLLIHEPINDQDYWRTGFICLPMFSKFKTRFNQRLFRGWIDFTPQNLGGFLFSKDRVKWWVTWLLIYFVLITNVFDWVFYFLKIKLIWLGLWLGFGIKYIYHRMSSYQTVRSVITIFAPRHWCK